MLVKAQICVDFAAGSEKSSSTTGRTTMGHVLAQSVAVEGLENKKKVVGSATEAPKYVPDGHHRPRPRTKFVPEGNFFVVSTCFAKLLAQVLLAVLDQNTSF